jgi:hypothetical protein
MMLNDDYSWKERWCPECKNSLGKFHDSMNAYGNIKCESCNKETMLGTTLIFEPIIYKPVIRDVTSIPEAIDVTPAPKSIQLLDSE